MQSLMMDRNRTELSAKKHDDSVLNSPNWYMKRLVKDRTSASNFNGGNDEQTLGNERAKRSSTSLSAHVASSPRFSYVNNGTVRNIENTSQPCASTPEFHSLGLPVCDTLKKAFRNVSRSNSVGSSSSKLFSPENARSRSVIEESLLEESNGSYLEEVSRLCKSFAKEKKNNNGGGNVSTSRIQDGLETSCELFSSRSPETAENASSILEQPLGGRKVLIYQSGYGYGSSILNVNSYKYGSDSIQSGAVERGIQGVVAFVDVRSSNENRFEGVAIELEKLGAMVLRKLSPEVTHVVFKNGRKSTLNFVEKHDVHFVSVLWVDSCKRTWSRVLESNFPAMKTEQSSLLGNIRGKLKRLKSLQPKAFEEDLTNSGKLERKRKKRNLAKEKKLELNLDLALWENAEKIDLSKRTPDNSILNSPLGNESPFLQQVKKRWAEKRASLGASPSPKLFEFDEEDFSSASHDDSLKERIESILNSSNTSEGRNERTEKNEASRSLQKKQICEGSDNDADIITQSSNVGEKLNDLSKRKSSSCNHGTNIDSSSIIKKRESTSCNKYFEKAPMRSKLNASVNGHDQDFSPSRNVDNGKPRSALEDNNETNGGVSSNDGVNSRVSCDIGKSNSVVIPVQSSCGNSEERTLGIDDSKRSDTCQEKLKKKDLIGENEKQNVSTDVNSNKKVDVVLDIAENETERKGVCSAPNSSDNCHSRTSASVSYSVNSQRLGLLSSGNSDSSHSVGHIEKLGEKKSPSLPVNHGNEGQCGSDTGRTGKSIDSGIVNSENICSSTTAIDGSKEDTLQCKPTRKRRKLLAKDHAMVTEFPAQQNKTEENTLGTGSTKAGHEKVKELQKTEVNKGNNEMSPAQKRKRQSPTAARKKRKQHEETPKKNKGMTENVSDSTSMVGQDVTEIPRRTEGSECAGKGVTSATNKTKGKKYRAELKGTLPDNSETMMEVDEATNDCNGVASLTNEVNKMVDAKKANKSTKNAEVKKKKLKKSLVMTSLHFSEQTFVRKAVAKLGDFNVTENVTSSTTHVIAGSNRRTLNILNAVIQGVWILSPDWVSSSLDKGEWLEESAFELTSDFPAARPNRCKKAETGESPLGQLLKCQAPFYVPENTTPPKEVIVKLVRKCGGQSTSCVRKAEICIGRCPQEDAAITQVEERWLLDCIMKSRILDLSEYLISELKEKH